jgi:putative transposase
MLQRMPRTARVTPGGLVYHVLNRGVGRMTLFEKAGDYESFVRVLGETLARHPGIRLLTWCILPNHWHMVVWPRGDRDLGSFMQRLTITHTRRWQEHRGCHGSGHVYQGRYKSFPVERDEHLLTVIRYVERNALRANLVAQAEAWRWCGLWVRRSGNAEQRAMLSSWPVPEPPHWLRTVNAPLSERELAAVRAAIVRGRPFGSEQWAMRTAKALGLEHSFRSRGRPRRRSP